MSRYKTIETEVEVDLDEWDDDELKAELEARGNEYQFTGPSFLNEEDSWAVSRALRAGNLDELRHLLAPLLRKHNQTVK